MPDFAVVTTFRATDKMSPTFNKMTVAAYRFGNQSVGAMAKARVAMSNLLSKAAMFAKLGVGIGAGIIVKEFIDFDHAITAASAKFPDLNRNTKAGQKTLEELRLTARRVGRDTQFSAGQAAKGLDYLAMAGFNAQQSMKLLPGVADLATVADIDFARATDIASDALGAFGLMTKDTNQLAINFTRIQDVMAKTITLTNTDMEMLFETMKYGAAPFTAAGQTLETFNAIAGRMASSGIKGSQAGTALRAAIVRLQKPTKDVNKGLATFGLSTESLIKDGKLMDMVEILKLLEKNGKNLTAVERNMALASIFGTRAVSAFSSVLNEGIQNTVDLKEALLKSGGSAKKMAEIMRGSLLNKLKALWSAIVELGFKFIDAFSSKGVSAVDNLTNAARNLGPVFSFLGKTFSIIAGFLPTIIKGFLIYKGVLLATFLIQKAQIALSWIKFLWSMIPVMRASIASQGLFNFLLKGTTFYQTILALKTKALAAAQWLLNAAMSANPIGLIIIAIVALVAWVVIAIRNWDEFGAAMMLLLGPLGQIITIFKVMYDRWNAIKNAFTSGGIIAGLKEIGKAIIDSMLLPIQQLLQMLSSIPGVGNIAGKGAAIIKELRRNVTTPGNYQTNANVNVNGQINIANAPEGSTAFIRANDNFTNLAMMGAQ